MNQAVIFFVPAGVAPRDFEAKLRPCFTTVQGPEVKPQMNEAQKRGAEAMNLPLWTWFIPNGRR
jgi:hypothetical protein